MPGKVVIVDYGTGNLSSVARALDRLGVDFLVSSSASEISGADRLILTGVGHFKEAMSSLVRKGLIDPLERAVLRDGKPILGICLGMELMARRSEEGNVAGLGWLEGNVVRFTISDPNRYKVPHIGWAQVDVRKPNRLMDEIPESAEFYFLHSYYLELGDSSLLLSEATHEVPFAAAVQKENILGVQYHPEKSHRAGLKLLENFIHF